MPPPPDPVSPEVAAAAAAHAQRLRRIADLVEETTSQADAALWRLAWRSQAADRVRAESRQRLDRAHGLAILLCRLAAAAEETGR